VKSELSEALVEACLKAGKMASCHLILVVGPEQPRLRSLKKKLVYATSEPHIAQDIEAAGYQTIVLPGLTAGRMDRLKAALVGAISAGHLKKGDEVLCAISREGSDAIETVMHLSATDEVAGEHSSLLVSALRQPKNAQLLEVIVSLCLRIGQEGYEGRALGALIVIGDSTSVMEKSHPLTLNPFQGYSEAERNLFDAHVRDAVRTFAMLDGAFIVRDDGVVLAAGRHIRVVDTDSDVPLGLGARHAAASAISIETDALAVAVSQSSGDVRVFRNGEIILQISPSTRRGDGNTTEVQIPTKKSKSRTRKSTPPKASTKKPTRSN
jgi:diadenylate cyclase